MPPKNSGGSTKFPGGHKVIHRTAQTAFVRVVTPRNYISSEKQFPRDGKRFYIGLTIMSLNKHYELLFVEENRHTSLVQTFLKKINYFSHFPSLPLLNYGKICNN